MRFRESADWRAFLCKLEFERTAARPPLKPLSLSKVNDGVYRLLSSQGVHLGNLKLIEGRWKFKAVGYGAQGEVIPGGGPLTGAHNSSFDHLDEADIAASLFPA